MFALLGLVWALLPIIVFIWLIDVSKRVGRIEGRLVPPPHRRPVGAPARDEQAPEPGSSEEEPAAEPVVGQAAQRLSEPPAPAPAPEALAYPPERQCPPEPSPEKELTIGRDWLAWSGAIAVALSLVYFVGAIYPMLSAWAKVGIGFLSGGALIYGGAAIRRREGTGALGVVVASAGWAVCYFTAYAMHKVPEVRVVESPLLGGLALAGVTLGAVLHAVRRGGELPSALAFLLGFMTTVVAADAEISGFTLVSSSLLVLGLVAVCVHKGWSRLLAIGIVATYLTHLIWISPKLFAFADDGFFLDVGFGVLYFAAFSFGLARVDGARGSELAFPAALNALLFPAVVVGGMPTTWRHLSPLFLIGTAAAEAVMGWSRAAVRRPELAPVHRGMALALLTLAIPAAAGKEWTAAAWLVELPVLAWLARRNKGGWLAVVQAGLTVAAFGHVTGIWEVRGAAALAGGFPGLEVLDVDPVWVDQPWLGPFAFLAFAGAAALGRGRPEEGELVDLVWRAQAVATALLAATMTVDWTDSSPLGALVLIAVGFAYYAAGRWLGSRLVGTLAHLLVAFGAAVSLWNVFQVFAPYDAPGLEPWLAAAAIWWLGWRTRADGAPVSPAVYTAVGAVLAGVTMRFAVPHGGLTGGLSALAVGLLLQGRLWRAPAVRTMGHFAFAVAWLWGVSVRPPDDFPWVAAPWLTAGAMIAVGLLGRGRDPEGTRWAQATAGAMLLAVSIGRHAPAEARTALWAVESLLLVGLGIRRGEHMARWLGLVGFGLLGAKVLFIDLMEVPTPLRVLSLGTLGLALLVAAYAYHRASRAIESEAEQEAGP